MMLHNTKEIATVEIKGTADSDSLVKHRKRTGSLSGERPSLFNGFSALPFPC